ncbi:MAG: aminotransferase class III-fold pyridoxal phosphate-dependent enzyme, partial [Anaerolineae bacterium]|nr:aminotransferase class III-fold pyridoxal phosphate-dependent enzyme [Anaerolineae bacterium]MDW8072236.1 aminotransferase class III-fold pyridoxal phosphate-dependent enzyme [Anaerolineae bacterium]
REMAVRHPSIGDVRGKGLMIGIELVKDRATRQPAKELRDRTVHLAFEHGLLILGCGTSVIRIAPPLIISRAEMTEGLQILDYALAKAEEELL